MSKTTNLKRDRRKANERAKLLEKASQRAKLIEAGFRELAKQKSYEAELMATVVRLRDALLEVRDDKSEPDSGLDEQTQDSGPCWCDCVHFHRTLTVGHDESCIKARTAIASIDGLFVVHEASRPDPVIEKTREPEAVTSGYSHAEEQRPLAELLGVEPTVDLLDPTDFIGRAIKGEQEAAADLPEPLAGDVYTVKTRIPGLGE